MEEWLQVEQHEWPTCVKRLVELDTPSIDVFELGGSSVRGDGGSDAAHMAAVGDMLADSSDSDPVFCPTHTE